MGRRTSAAVGAVIAALVVVAAIIVFLSTDKRDKAELTPPEEYISSALSEGAFSVPLYAVDNAVGFMLYGLNAEDYSFAEFYFSDGASAEELAYLTAKSEEGLNAALSAISRRIDEQIAECEGYLPAEIRKLENAVIRQAPDKRTISFAVADDYTKLPATLYD
ncbi:MAG: DUF4358 domain-containing protein [Oscillospiraceae bacterium]|jgi:hypothetical protein|nr:DUF4358 domain-containing protein [Oscillospiraceae bacterium]